MGSNDATAYWNINVPERFQTAECPPYLVNLPPKDLRTICTPDSEFKVDSWDRVKEIVRSNKLDHFERVPSEYRRYRAFTYALKQQYGSVGTFMLNVRLGWPEPVRAKGKPFECPEEDVKVLYNDWPYGIDPRIVHLAVWTKFPLAEDPASATADLTEECRQQIENFMEKTFYRDIPRDRVVWFRNWSAIKSVHAVEHFHVMILDPDPDFIRNVTNGDVPQCQKPDP